MFVLREKGFKKMKIFGICGSTIENLKSLNPNSDIQFCTVIEYLTKDFNKEKPICLVDQITKLALFLNVKVLDIIHNGVSFKKRSINYENLDRFLPKIKEIEDVDLMTRINIDVDLGEYSWIIHLNEFHQSFRNFIFKLDSRLMGNKEKFSISKPYQEKMKNLFEKASDYQNFKNKVKGDYPVLFSFLKKNLKIFEDKNPEEKEEVSEGSEA